MLQCMNEKKRAPSICARPVQKRFQGGDVHCSMTIRSLAFERPTVVRTDA